MAKFSLIVSLAILLILITTSEAATPLFLSAITSALATMPFTGGPMTTGIIGAKLGIGTKLLFYLGYFGQRSRPKPAPKAPKISSSGGLPGQLQPLPLPYMFSGGGLPTSNFQTSNFQPASGFPSSSFSSNFNPAQLFQILTEYGVDPNLVMEALNNAGGISPGGNPAFTSSDSNPGFGTGGGFGGSNGGFGGGSNAGFGTNGGFGGGSNAEFGTNGGFGGGSNAGFETNGGFEGVSNSGFGGNGGFGGDANAGFGANTGFSSNVAPGQTFVQPGSVEHVDTFQPPNIPSSENEVPSSGGSEDVESFFTFLKDMDENSCISRLVCDIGQNPSFLGDFSENIYSMVGSLNVQQSSRAYQYVDIMEKGKAGQCREKFLECTDMAYEIVKNVAPSVGIPQNVDPALINQL